MRDKPPIRFDLSDIPNVYSVETNNLFDSLLKLDDKEVEPYELWSEIKKVIKISADNHIPKQRKCKMNNWIL